MKDSNKERTRKYQADYRAANKERLVTQRADYRAANKERYLEYQADYRAANKERIRAQQAIYRAANKEPSITKHTDENMTPKERIRAQQAIYRNDNKIEPLPQAPGTVTRKQALEQGLKRYFTGNECINGHVTERSINGGCLGCIKDRMLRGYFKKRGPNAP